MDHSFSVEVAKKLGIAPAVILNNLYWWIEKNKANEKHFYDGYYWTYNSRKAFVSQFPYFTERQIEYALRKLVDGGYVITGNYNKANFDRTLWYTLTQAGYALFSISQNCEMETTKLLNANNKNVKPIPDINTDSKPTDNPLPTVKGEQAPSGAKKSYKEIFNDPENTVIRDALVKFVNYCKGKNYNPKISTVEKFASTLRTNAKDDPVYAMAMVDKSIKENWKDIYPLKNGYKKEAVSIPVSAENKAKNTDGSYVVF